MYVPEKDEQVVGITISAAANFASDGASVGAMEKEEIISEVPFGPSGSF